jgi:hypothetical protein
MEVAKDWHVQACQQLAADESQYGDHHHNLFRSAAFSRRAAEAVVLNEINFYLCQKDFSNPSSKSNRRLTN